MQIIKYHVVYRHFTTDRQATYKLRPLNFFKLNVLSWNTVHYQLLR